MSIHNELDLQGLWKELDEYVEELNKESDVLQEVWLRIAQIKGKNDEDLNELAEKAEFAFMEPETVVIFNVGGQLFESTVAVMTRDPYSILAACCRVDSPIYQSEEGVYFFDRDWWLFRHILSFLRSNTLPNELETLKELYTEASFYRLESLQKAIENISISEINNFTPQIAVTWPGKEGAMDYELLRRPKDSFVFNESLFKY